MFSKCKWLKTAYFQNNNNNKKKNMYQHSKPLGCCKEQKEQLHPLCKLLFSFVFVIWRKKKIKKINNNKNPQGE